MRSHSRFTDHDRSGGEELDEGVIEVQVIPQDDNWGETATTITETTATSVISGISETNLSDIGKDFRPCRFNFRRHCGFAFTALLGSLGVLSPVVFVIIPILLGESQGFLNDCSSVGSEPTTANVTRYLNECDGLYMSLGFREVILIAGIWALYFRTPRINFPRVNRLKISVMGLAFIIVMSYWVIFGYRMFEDGSKSSKSIVQFALSLADTLLFVHYLSLVALWFRQSRVTFTMKVIRSTDGVSRFYNVGLMSIQQAAAFVLNHYYKDFPEYNPLLMSIPSARKSQNKETTSIKFYDIDGRMGNDSANANSRARAVIAATARKRESRHNDRFYEEEEYARRVKKRRARLVTATEEAFTHVKKLKLERGPCVPLDAEEAAQAIFPSLARPLQKYLRTTRQQYRYSMESILKHLAHCLIFDMTPKAFLERYVNEQPCVQLLAENIKSWRLVCEEQLTSSITKSTVFQLLRDEYSLVVTVNQLPQYDIMEEDFDFDDNQFVLRLNSETSV